MVRDEKAAVSHDVVRLGTTACQDEAGGEDRSCKRRRQDEDGSHLKVVAWGGKTIKHWSPNPKRTVNPKGEN